MRRFLFGFFGLALSFSAAAGNAQAVLKTAEATMQVTGEVVIAADGSLESYAIDRSEAVPSAVRSLLGRYFAACEFDVRTASGRPEAVKAKMSVQLLARPTPDGNTVIAVNSSLFEASDTPQTIVAKDMQPPKYPVEAMYQGLSGTVYLVLRLNADGTVAQVHTEQVNMTVIGDEYVLRQGRNILARAAMNKAQHWTFQIEPQRLDEPAPLSVRVPVDFSFDEKPVDENASDYGKWRGYVPGPYTTAPWNPQQVANGIGAMTPGRLYTLDPPIKLRDPPSGS